MTCSTLGRIHFRGLVLALLTAYRSALVKGVVRV